MTRPWLVRLSSRPQRGGGHVHRGGLLAKELATQDPVMVALDADGMQWAPFFADSTVRVVAADRLMPDACWRGVVVDCYDVGPSELIAFSKRAPLVALFDDSLATPPGTGLVINAAPNLAGDQIAGVPALLGAQYAIVDPSFTRLPRRAAPARPRTLMLCFGLRDSANACALALAALERIDAALDRPNIRVILAEDAPHRADVARRVASFGPRGVLLPPAPSLAPLLAECDLFLGAGGVSLLERMAAGVPSVTVVTAGNQLPFARAAHDLGGTLLAGSLDGLSCEALADNIQTLADDASARARMAEAGRRGVDGGGIARVAAALRTAVGGDHGHDR